MNYRRYVFLFLVISMVLSGATIFVDTSGSEGDSLQRALDSTRVLPGIDTVLVMNGTYHLAINPFDTGYIGLDMRDSVYLSSVNGMDYCTLSASSRDMVDTAWHVIDVYQLSHKVTIKGFTIKDGRANYGVYSGRTGAGIHIAFSSPNIIGNRICKNYADYDGGGLWIGDSSRPVVSNNIISGNRASYEGGGIFVYWASFPEFSGNYIMNNDSDTYGGGIGVSNYCRVIMRENVISGNKATYGGGISCFIQGNKVELYKNLITANVADSGGAFYTGDHSKFIIDSCFIVDNVSLRSCESGFTYLSPNADSGITFSAHHSNIYYNSFQPDIEFHNATGVTLPLEENYWWFTDSSGVDDIIKGPASFYPLEDSILDGGVPCEPLSIDSIRNYRSRDYSERMDSIGTYDTLFVSLYGRDANSGIKGTAVTVLTSSQYPMGIAVTLRETDTNSGVYRSPVVPLPRYNLNNLLYDDACQQIGVNVQDTIKITANTDNSTYCFVGYNAPYSGVVEVVENESEIFKIESSLIHDVIEARYELKTGTEVELSVYDVDGRKVKVLRDFIDKGARERYYDLNNLRCGVYFLRVSICGDKFTEKIIKIR